MPLYEYRCSQCRKEFELLVRGETKPVCPHCKSKRLERQMSAPAAPSSNAGPECPGRSDSCREQPMPCCGARGCCL